MEFTVSRRKVLAVTGGAVGVAIAVESSSAASNLSLSVSNISTETNDGSINGIFVTGSDSTVDMDWSGFDSDPSPTIRYDFRADPNSDTTNSHLIGTDATSYNHDLGNGYILSSSYGGLSGGSGSVTGVTFPTIFSNTSFPIEIVSPHGGLVNEDFIPDYSGETEQVVLQHLVEFEDTNQSVLETVTTTHTVTVDYVATEISGIVTSGGSALQGAKVYVISTSDNTVAGVDTSASDGSYAISGLSSGEYHVLVQYKDGSGNVYTDYSKPFITL